MHVPPGRRRGPVPTALAVAAVLVLGLLAPAAVRAVPDPYWNPLVPAIARGELLQQVEDAVPPALLALGLLLAPLLAGLGLGRLASAAAGERARSSLAAAVLGAAPLALVPLLPPVVLPMGVWDLGLACAFLGLGLVLGVHRLGAALTRANLAALAAGLAAAALVLELGVRALVPGGAPEIPDAERARLFPPFGGPTHWHASVCPALWPSDHSPLYGDRLARTVVLSPRRRVLHVGDSMVEGDGVDAATEAFPALLERLDPGVQHLNAGFGGTGPDFHLRLLRAWLPKLRPDAVVVHLFAGNDLENLDQPYGCCDGGPLLDYGPEGPSSRCPQAAWDLSLRARLGVSPPPYPLLRLAPVSEAARHLSAGVAALGAVASGRPGEDERWGHLQRVLEALRDECAAAGASLRVVVLPARGDLERPDGEAARGIDVHRRMLALARGAGIETLDAWDLLREAVKRDGSPSLFLSRGGGRDVHFSPGGHDRVARWLLASLGPGLAGDPAEVAPGPPDPSDPAAPPRPARTVGAGDPAPGGRVLGPAASGIVMEALSALRPAFAAGDVRIRPAEVETEVCTAPGREACAKVRLSDPAAACAGERSGTWCLAFPGGAPPSGLGDALRAALQRPGAGDPWEAPRGGAAPGGDPGFPSAPRGGDRPVAHYCAVYGLAFSPDGTRTASASCDGTVGVWAVPSGERLARVRLRPVQDKGGFYTAAWSPDDRVVAAGGVDAAIHVLDATTYRPVATWRGHAEAVAWLAFSPDGSLLASASWDDTVRLWDAVDGTPLWVGTHHQGDVNTVAWSPDGRRFATSSMDTQVMVWDVRGPVLEAVLSGHRGNVEYVDFSPDGTRLVSGGDDNAILVWDLGEMRQTGRIDGHADQVESVRWSRWEDVLYAAGKEEVIRAWDPASLRRVRQWTGLSARVFSQAVSPVSPLLAAGQTDGRVCLWTLPGFTGPRMAPGFVPGAAAPGPAACPGREQAEP